MTAPTRNPANPRTVRDLYAGRLWPNEQMYLFSRSDRMFATRAIRRGGRVRQLPPSGRRLDDFSFESGGQTYDLYDYVSRNRIVGLLILKQGEVVLEHYDFGMSDTTRWMSMSMAKSISSTLVGVAIQDGHIGSIDDPLTDYLPALRGGAYADVSIRQLLRMTSGARWAEAQTDATSERRQVLELQLAQKPGAIVDFMSRLPKEAAAGQRWNYSTGETHIVGALLHAATGRWLSDYLSDSIWSRAGMWGDASWWLEAPGGLEVAGSGIGATLRDYARFGLFMLEDGVVDNVRVLPPGWTGQAGAGHFIGDQPIAYGYMWWPVPAMQGGERYNGFSARGIFGQRLHINPEHDLVVAMLSARSKPMYSEVIDDNDFFNVLSRTL